MKRMTRSPLAPFLAGGVLGMAAMALLYHLESEQRASTTVGATAEVLEASSGLQCLARVDTGAEYTSIDCPLSAVRFEDPAAEQEDRVGQTVQLDLTDDDGKTATINSRIAGFSRVRTADSTEQRYQISLRLRMQGVERSVVVTLNDRSSMRHKLLLGRNFLRDRFLVDVAIDNPQP